MAIAVGICLARWDVACPVDMTGGRPALLLRGRRSACEVLDRMLEGAGSGRAAALVLRGEAGVGKTALLEYVSAEAVDWQIARAAGVDSELEPVTRNASASQVVTKLSP